MTFYPKVFVHDLYHFRLMLGKLYAVFSAQPLQREITNVFIDDTSDHLIPLLIKAHDNYINTAALLLLLLLFSS